MSIHHISEYLDGNSDSATLGPRRKYAKTSVDTWAKCSVIEADSLPHDIDGLCVFKITNVSPQDRMAKLKDGRNWGPAKTSHRKGVLPNHRRIQDCAGSLVCDNDHCMFFDEYHVKNQFHFEGGNCALCGKVNKIS